MGSSRVEIERENRNQVSFVSDATRTSLIDLRQRLDSIGSRLDVANDQREIEDLERRSLEPGFWEDAQRAQRVMRHLGQLRNRVETFTTLGSRIDDLADLTELAADDPDLKAEIDRDREDVEGKLAALEIELAMTGPYDDHEAILIVHSGEGGIDAQDFAEMLARMYIRWAEKKGYKVEILDRTDGEEAGVKDLSLSISGPHAYGYLKSEAGPHRLVRLSPFDSQHRRHTAFSLVEVIPEIESDSEVDLNLDDVRVDTYRASGAGGQHVNKTSSAIRLTHLPTGIVVTCQNERSQMQNRDTAFKILRSRLLEIKLESEAEERSRLKGDRIAAGFGSRIRSYVLQPYTMVTDHRTDVSVPDAQGVLDGNLDPFIDGFLQQQIGVEETA
jgi:peptide chain release factor 2